MQCILIKANEIFLKSNRTRPAFEKRFVAYIREGMARKGIVIHKLENIGSLFVLTCDNFPLALEALAHIPGVDQFSLSHRLTFGSLEDLVAQCYALTCDLVRDKIFCVRVKKKVGEFPFRSREAEFAIGSKLHPLGKGVDLVSPQVCIMLELRRQDCFLYTDIQSGIGGLLTGSRKKLLCMFSGGMDSPVAAIEFLRKGCHVDFLFVNIIGEKNLQDVARVYNHVVHEFVYGYMPRFFVIDASSLSSYLRSEVKDNLKQIALKVALYSIASSVCKDQGYEALISGEAIGQKSSQTLDNLLFLQRFLQVPLFRPLLCFDKTEILEKTRSYGTYKLSEKVKEVCNLSTGPVVTHITQEEIKDIPDMSGKLPVILATLFIHEGRIVVEEANAPQNGSSLIVVDMRMEHHQGTPFGLSIPYPAILKKLDTFEMGKNYLLVCEYGVRSAEIAYALRKKGIAAVGMAQEKYEKYFLKK